MNCSIFITKCAFFPNWHKFVQINCLHNKETIVFLKSFTFMFCLMLYLIAFLAPLSLPIKGKLLINTLQTDNKNIGGRCG